MKTFEKFIAQHESMSEYLARSEEAAKTLIFNNLKKEIAEFVKIYREHAGLIKSLERGSEHEIFLDYPFSAGFITFNPTRDYRGAIREADILEHLLITTTSVESERITLSHVRNYNEDYKNRIKFVKDLLEKASA